MKLTLTRIVRKDTDKNNQPLVTKDGRAYTRLGVQAQEYGSKWLSSFSAPWNQDWKEGQIVECDVQQKGEYLNISKPDPFTEIAKTIMSLSVRVGKLEQFAKELSSTPPNRYIPTIESEVDDVGELVDDTSLPF